MRKFNVTGSCHPNRHYMVDISNKIAKIKELVDDQSYFTINRARQYGKTTTLFLLEEPLSSTYTVVSISFEGIDDEGFASPAAFCRSFLRLIYKALAFTDVADLYRESWLDKTVADFQELNDHITKMCAQKKIVLIIDEVDKISNNRVFLHFLGMLRTKYLARNKKKDHTFHSVILAGVYDIKNIKLKIMKEDTGSALPGRTSEGSTLYNSPWNIASDFDVDMSFNPHEIATMLTDYEADHHTNMDITALSEEIYSYTHGYPFLVSRICQRLDENLNQDWSPDGVRHAVAILLREKNTLFDDIFKNLENHKDLYEYIYDILVLGEPYTFQFGNPIVELAHTFGIIRDREGKTAIANRIFETLIYEYFISKEHINEEKRLIKGVLPSDIISSGKFDMPLCLNKFSAHYYEMFCERDIPFLERHGRLLFLTYLKPLINDLGFYHIESETRNQRRMDIVLDYNQEQFIIELKIWHGDTYKQEAYKQLRDYLISKNATTGYLLTFDFRKGSFGSRNDEKQPSSEWVTFEGVHILDIVVRH